MLCVLVQVHRDIKLESRGTRPYLGKVVARLRILGQASESEPSLSADTPYAGRSLCSFTSLHPGTLRSRLSPLCMDHVHRASSCWLCPGFSSKLKAFVLFVQVLCNLQRLRPH